MYYPLILPANSPTCIFEDRQERAARKGESNGILISLKICGKKTGDTSFCVEHDYVLEILDLGAVLGYPRLDLNQYLSIGEGLASWEGYAVRHPQWRNRAGKKHNNHLEVKTKLHALIRSFKEQNDAARMEAVYNSRQDDTDGRQNELVNIDDKMYVPF